MQDNNLDNIYVLQASFDEEKIKIETGKGLVLFG